MWQNGRGRERVEGRYKLFVFVCVCVWEREWERVRERKRGREVYGKRESSENNVNKENISLRTRKERKKNGVKKQQ